MDGKRAEQVEVDLDGRTIPATVPPESALRPGWAAVLGVGWPLAFLIMLALEPAPADPQAAQPLAGTLLAVGFMAGLLLTSAAAGTRHRLAAGAATVTGVFALVGAAACPASGHHAYGAWWFAQMAVVIAMLGVSVAALGARARA
jgi:hypothetical protein